MDYATIISQLETLPLANSQVQSFCLFNSDRFSVEKHLKPFFRYLRENPQLPLLIFITEDFKYADEVCEAFSENHHSIRVPPLPYYNAHLYRYFAGFTRARVCIYVGTDTPEVRDSFKQCIDTLLCFNYTFHASFMERSPQFQLSGRVATQKQTSRDLAKFAMAYVEKNSPQWNCDQLMMRDFYRQFKPSSVFFAPYGLYSVHSREFALDCIASRPTILIRTRNEFDT